MPVEGRMLKAKISLNEALAELDNDTHRLLFTWAIPHLDREGRISGSPRVFKATVAPLLDHLTPEKISKFFRDAHGKGLINYYETDGGAWVQYPKFKENQKIKEDRETPSRIPPPPENSGELLSTPDNLLSPPPEEKRREVKRREHIHGRNCFDEFWQAYPKKVKKPAALSVWNDLSKKNQLPELQIILQAIGAQKTWEKWTEDGGRYIPDPERWLKNHRWNDEPNQCTVKYCGHGLNPGECPICKEHFTRGTA